MTFFSLPLHPFLAPFLCLKINLLRHITLGHFPHKQNYFILRVDTNFHSQEIKNSIAVFKQHPSEEMRGNPSIHLSAG